jgi:DNA-binding NarL/FixJ family response regulator
MIRIAIADDQELVRAGLRMIIAGEADLEVVGEAASGEEAVTLVRQVRPDVLLMDVRMPGLGGIGATEAITTESGGRSRVLILTTFDLDEYVYDALRAGASGFLLKDVPGEDLVIAIRQAARGTDALLSPSVTRRLVERFASQRSKASPRPDVLHDLTAREQEVLGLVARGLSNSEIADRLTISETTVKSHVGHLLMKLGLRDRVQAVVLAYETGLVTAAG